MPKNKIITGLDIGTSALKVLAVVKKPQSQDFEVLGQVQRSSFGVRRGVVANVDEVSQNITNALLELQSDIGHKIDDVYVNMSGSHIFAMPSRGTVVVSRADQSISKEDIKRVIRAAQALSLPSNKEILDVFPKEFIVDGQGQIKEPLGMQGLRLEAEVLLLCVFSPFFKNLTSAILNAGLQISDITPSSLASGEAVLTPQQKELGVCLLDIGAGTTDMVVYEEGDLIHTAVFPLGSERITNDLAVVLKTDIDIAEKIKREFGTCLFSGGNKKEKIVPSQELGNGEPLVFSHKVVAKVIEARVCEIFDLVRQELKKISLRGSLPAGLVLTGGGVKLPKIVELAKQELKLPARIGLPILLEQEKDAAWSTAAGLVLMAGNLENSEDKRVLPVLRGGAVAKLKRIFRIFIP